MRPDGRSHNTEDVFTCESSVTKIVERSMCFQTIGNFPIYTFLLSRVMRRDERGFRFGCHIIFDSELFDRELSTCSISGQGSSATANDGPVQAGPEIAKRGCVGRWQEVCGCAGLSAAEASMQ